MSVKKNLLLFIISVALLWSCTPKLVPSKSAYAMALLQTIPMEINSIYDRASTGLQYSALVVDYNTTLADIDSLISHDEKRNKADKMVFQDLAIRKIFNSYKEAHQIKNTLNPSEVRVFRSYMKSIITPRLISENQTN